MKVSTKMIVQTALLLAICIASQFMKNLSVYLTGPIVNITMIMAVLMIGIRSGMIIAILSPLTAFWIAPSPIMMGIPLVIPCIMVGNVLLVSSIWLFHNKIMTKTVKTKLRVAIGMGIGAVIKAAFMGVSIVLILLPMYSGNIAVPEQKLNIILNTARVTFSVTQLITAVIGCAISYIVWLRIKKTIRED